MYSTGPISVISISSESLADGIAPALRPGLPRFTREFRNRLAAQELHADDRQRDQQQRRGHPLEARGRRPDEEQQQEQREGRIGDRAPLQDGRNGATGPSANPRRAGQPGADQDEQAVEDDRPTLGVEQG